jgi:hypothetical protein
MNELYLECKKILEYYYPQGTHINECSKEWVEKGHKISAGIVKYYSAYFSKEK